MPDQQRTELLWNGFFKQDAYQALRQPALLRGLQ
jgi:hypothetical protein